MSFSKSTKLFFILASCVVFLSVESASFGQEYCQPVPMRRARWFGFRRVRPQFYAPMQHVTPHVVSTGPAFNCCPTVGNQTTPSTVVAEATAEPTPAEPSGAEVVPADPTPTEPALAEPAPTSVEPTKAAPTAAAPKSEEGWRSMFDGQQLGEWKVTKFGGEGDVLIEDQAIKLDYGQYMTGITHSGKNLPKVNYEIQLEAMREEGSDFFCGLTFPVNDKHVSLIIGGWGGSVLGISNIDDMDASENETTVYLPVKNKQWYKIKLLVTAEKIVAWLDDKEIVDVEIKDRRLSTRIEVDLCKPLGIASFDTQAAIRNIRIRDLPAKSPPVPLTPAE